MLKIALIDNNLRRREQLALALISIGGFEVVTFSDRNRLFSAADSKSFSLCLCSFELYPVELPTDTRTFYFVAESIHSRLLDEIPLKQRLSFAPQCLPAFAQTVHSLVRIDI